MSAAHRRRAARVFAALALFGAAELLVHFGAAAGEGGLAVQFALFAVPYLVAGYDVLAKAVRGIGRGQVFDENFLMALATLGAFSLVLFPESEPHMAEGAAVMLFYQLGELFQSYAVDKSRRSISDLMDIAPEHANVERDGVLVQVDPYEVEPQATIVVKPGERVPLDGVVVAGASQLDMAALTGEAVPCAVQAGDEVASGSVNLTGVLTVRVTRPFEQSTVQRILELVEEASERKARAESFITRFARWYTPVVVGVALLLALATPLLFGTGWASGVESALVFLVVSCPCALVISVPLSFFAGLGAASRHGILVKGSSYLEALGACETVVFDKTGTLTNGRFEVVEVRAREGSSADEVLANAASAERYSDHPVARAIVAAGRASANAEPLQVEERAGYGVVARIDGTRILVGNDALMRAAGIEPAGCDGAGTPVHVARDGAWLGCIVVADVPKPDAAQALADLRAAGVKRTVMLTGDAQPAADAAATQLGVDEWHARLLPADKVAHVERLLGEAGRRSTLAFAGDGINDAPVLMRADVGIAMGALGSDAAIEAADVVLMDDAPSKIAVSMRIARKTMRIVRENVVFALGVKLAIMVLALPVFGMANMWMAVFGDVGVSCLAILNAMRALRAA